MESQLGRRWPPPPVLLPGKSHGRRSLVGYSPWGRKESDTTEWLHFHFSFSCTGEGNGKPLQCSCLENLRDRGAWWAAVYGVAQSRTRLKQLSGSSMFSQAQRCEDLKRQWKKYLICQLAHSTKVWFLLLCCSHRLLFIFPLLLKFLKKE